VGVNGGLNVVQPWRDLGQWQPGVLCAEVNHPMDQLDDENRLHRWLLRARHKARDSATNHAGPVRFGDLGPKGAQVCTGDPACIRQGVDMSQGVAQRHFNLPADRLKRCGRGLRRD
jgi:hypothetical protein